MELAIANKEGILFLLRWIHFLAGITWIGMLYYFNFVQGDFFKTIDANTKNIAVSKLVPTALWWFRWGAMLTFLSGISLIGLTIHMGVPLNSSWGVLILIGGILATLMWFNVWFIIWPAQKVVIASAKKVLEGGQAIPDAAVKAGRALVVSRTNVMFSFPMLFFMGAARHFNLLPNISEVNIGILAAVLGVITLLLEINSLKGKTGPLTSVKGVITCGFLLTAIFYLLIETLAYYW